MRLFLSSVCFCVYPVFHWEEIFWKMSKKGGLQKIYERKEGDHIVRDVYSREGLKPIAHYGTLIKKDDISEGGLISYLCI